MWVQCGYNVGTMWVQCGYNVGTMWVQKLKEGAYNGEIIEHY